MRKLSELDRDTLESIVVAFQESLYLDTDGEREFWNPDKVWNPVDQLDAMQQVLERHGLIPDQEEPVGAD